MAAEHLPIIDVTPVASAREAVADAADAAGRVAAAATHGAFQAPSYGKRHRKVKNEPLHKAGFGNAAPAQTTGTPPATEGAKPGVGGRVGGAVETVAGVGIMAIGVPLLVLPGPGVLVIGGGAALAARGVRKLVGGKQ